MHILQRTRGRGCAIPLLFRGYRTALVRAVDTVVGALPRPRLPCLILSHREAHGDMYRR